MHQATRFESLQALRAAAALAVMGFHATKLFAERAGTTFLGDFFLPGSAGVDLFFVLSGFIIYTTAFRGGDRSSFFLKRFIRLFPVYWIVTLLLLAAQLAAPSPAMSFKSDPTLVAQSLLLWPAPRHIVGVAWTLVYEVWFYALFGLLFYRSERLFFAVLGLWAGANWANALFFHWQPESYGLQFAASPVIGEFLFGCCAAAAFRRSRTLPATALVLAGAAGFLAAWLTHWLGALPVRWELAFGVPATLLVLGCAASGARVPRWLLFLGNASYSIYLLHATALSASLALLGWWRPDGASLGFVGCTLVLGASLAACCVFYQVIERPLLATCRRAWLAPRSETGGLPVAPVATPAVHS